MLQMIQNKVEVEPSVAAAFFLGDDTEQIEVESSVVAAYFLGVVTLLTSQSSQLAAELVRVNFLVCAVAHSDPCGQSFDYDEIV